MMVGPKAASRRSSESRLLASATPSRLGRSGDLGATCFMTMKVYFMTITVPSGVDHAGSMPAHSTTWGGKRASVDVASDVVVGPEHLGRVAEHVAGADEARGEGGR